MEVKGKWFISNEKLEETAQFDTLVPVFKNSVYEVIRFRNNKAVFLKEHFERLGASLTKLKVDYTLNVEAIQNLIEKLLSANNLKVGNFRIEFPLNQVNTSPILFIVLHIYPNETLYKTGIKTVTFSIERDNPQVKQAKVNQFVREHIQSIKEQTGAYEILLVNHNNEITEGSRSNVLFVSEKTIYTPPTEQILEGITRKVVLKLAAENGFEVIERPIKLDEITKFEACFITGTSPKILPIKQIDDLRFKIEHETVKTLIYEYNRKIADS